MSPPDHQLSKQGNRVTLTVFSYLATETKEKRRFTPVFVVRTPYRSAMSNKQLVYEGFTLPRLKVKEILASNAREDIELKNLHKKLDKEKDEVETDFSKTRSQLLSRALDHHMTLESQPSELENSANDGWETTSFSTLDDFSGSQDAFEVNCHSHPSDYHSNPKQSWAEKITHFEPSLTAKNELVASKSQTKHKISLGGRANPHVKNWNTARSERFEQSLFANQVDALETQTKRKTSGAGKIQLNTEKCSGFNLTDSKQFVVTKTSQPDRAKFKHNGKISWTGKGHVYTENWDTGLNQLRKSISEESVCSEPRASSPLDVSHSRERRHTIAGRSKSVSNKSSVFTKETLQKQRLSTPKHVVTRRHTVCCRPKRYGLSSSVKENASQQKPLADLLPPIKLPPVYLQEKKDKNQGKKTNNNVVNTSEKLGGKSYDDTIRDLKHCRYLRIKKSDDDEYASW